MEKLSKKATTKHCWRKKVNISGSTICNSKMKGIMWKMNNWQRIWDDDGSISRYSPIKIIAYVLSLPYCLIINFRNWLYDHKILQEEKLSCPVISVGNITVGGTGKTPCVIMLAQILQEGGFRPAILSRGYGGKSIKPVNICLLYTS